jgi:hypothetical protein
MNVEVHAPSTPLLVVSLVLVPLHSDYDSLDVTG